MIFLNYSFYFVYNFFKKTRKNVHVSMPTNYLLFFFKQISKISNSFLVTSHSLFDHIAKHFVLENTYPPYKHTKKATWSTSRTKCIFFFQSNSPPPPNHQFITTDEFLRNLDQLGHANCLCKCVFLPRLFPPSCHPFLSNFFIWLVHMRIAVDTEDKMQHHLDQVSQDISSLVIILPFLDMHFQFTTIRV